MKKIMTSAMALVLLLCTGSAQALCQQDSCYDSCVSCDPCCNDAWYIGGFGGANWLTGTKPHLGCFVGKQKYQTGYALAISVGRSFCGDFRGEFEYTYRETQFKNHNDCNFCAPHKGHIRSNSYMVNGFYDIEWCNDWCLKPFVGAGIGYATQHLDFRQNTFISDNRTNKKNGFAWQIIAGVAYPISDCIDISFEYRFYQGGLKKLYSQNLGAGFRYNF